MCSFGPCRARFTAVCRHCTFHTVISKHPIAPTAPSATHLAVPAACAATDLPNMQAVIVQKRPPQQSRASGRRPVRVSAYLTASAPPPTIQARIISRECAPFRRPDMPKGGIEKVLFAAAAAACGSKLAAPGLAFLCIVIGTACAASGTCQDRVFVWELRHGTLALAFPPAALVSAALHTQRKGPPVSCV